MALPPEREVLIARKAFPDAQVELSGVSAPYSGGPYALGWFGTRIVDERGAFAVVSEGGPLEDLIGEIVLLRYGQRSVFVYCVGASDIADYDIGVTRRAFAALAVLAKEEIAVLIEVVV